MNIYEKEVYHSQKQTPYIAQHHIMMKERSQMDVTGVKKLLSFDNEMFMLETLMGLLQVRGEDLELKNLNLEKGEIVITGYITGFEYDDYMQHGESSKGLFGKLFR